MHVSALGMLLFQRAPPRAPIPCANTEDVSVRLVTLQCPAELSASVLSDSLMEAGALYVGVSDGNVGTPDEEPIFAAHPPDSNGAVLESWDDLMAAKKLWSNSTLEVGFAPSADVERAMLSVIADAGLSVSYSVEELAPRDWVTEVQSNWPPVTLPGCLTIRFPWHDVAALEAAGAAAHGPIVTLHPGMAFGTGEHATTQLCCMALRRLLSRPDLRGAAVLDYGSGSGILSFAALQFGAGSAIGVEIDPEALATSRLNAAENGLTDRFVAELPEEEASREGTYPIVVANSACDAVQCCGWRGVAWRGVAWLILAGRWRVAGPCNGRSENGG